MAAATGRSAFITLEGGEGSGKTTLAAAIAEHFRDRAGGVCLTHEPGGTEFGRLVEGFLRDALSSPLSPLAEFLLFEADRVQHVTEVIGPALAAGRIVVCDRFTDSSLAYQGYGRGFDLQLIRRLNAEATGGLMPDLTLLLDVPPEVGLARAGDQTDITGRESLAFHKMVRDGFRKLAQAAPGRFVVIDGTLAAEEVKHRAVAAIRERLPFVQTV